MAVKELIKKGYQILEQNYHKITGEIDIIAKQGETIVFIEVKTRATLKNGTPSEAVNQKKQNRIIETAKYYIAEQNLLDNFFRFDVVEILYYHQTYYFRQIENAFCLF